MFDQPSRVPRKGRPQWSRRLGAFASSHGPWSSRRRLWKKTQGRKLLGQSIGKIHHDDDDDDDDDDGGDDRGENTTQYFSGIMMIPHIYIYTLGSRIPQLIINEQGFLNAVQLKGKMMMNQYSHHQIAIEHNG